jgi:hypothetical protein
MPPPRDWPDRPRIAPSHPIEARVAAAMEHLRELHETGEIEWTDVSQLSAVQMAFMND